MVAIAASKAFCLDRVVNDLEAHLDSAAKYLSKRTGSDIGSRGVILLIAVGFVLLPFDLVQLVFMTLGAVFYALIKAAAPTLPKVRKQKHVECTCSKVPRATPKAPKAASPPTGRVHSTSPQTTSNSTAMPRSPKVACTTSYTTSTSAAASWGQTQCPVKGYQFESTCWEAAVQELLSTLKPDAETKAAVRALADRVHKRLRAAFPGLEVDGFASAQLDQCRAFGVAVPDVEVVVRLPMSKNDSTPSARPTLRMITERLVNGKGEFKFRRSAFRRVEPKVTLLATPKAGVIGRAVPLDVSVNAILPGFSQALLAECQRLEPRSHDLYCLVRQWSKERGICYSPQGHLSPYLWCLLTVYYLQTGVKDEGSVLPKFIFDLKGDGPVSAPSVKVVSNGAPNAGSSTKKSVAALFRDFFHFYSSVFDWSADLVDVRASSAYDTKPPTSLERPVVHGVHIEDPLNFGQDLGAAMSELGGQRLREELKRASELCKQGQSLQELLQVWVPPANDDTPLHNESQTFGKMKAAQERDNKAWKRSSRSL
eukprot:TRINITY_DN1482_c0_g2_i2.p1 TRINITY_DN1482_c0_g2~~TRINITY_DN1482_c0_g2_i2.p1  ORF type:complete len:539 (-),score=97.01 TRINITY_DN1482_c0_g2_i2:103-1719(-)